MKRLWWIGLAVSVFVATGISYFASEHPDGLEFVAETLGFAETAGEHGAAGSPLADYGIAGLDNAFLSNAGAGLAGLLATLLLMVVLTRVLQRRVA